MTKKEVIGVDITPNKIRIAVRAVLVLVALFVPVVPVVGAAIYAVGEAALQLFVKEVDVIDESKDGDGPQE